MNSVQQSRKLFNVRRELAIARAFAVIAALLFSSNSVVFASLASPAIGNQVYSSGSDLYGKLGNGTEDLVSSPEQFPLPAGVTAQKVIQTQANILVLGSNGQVYGAGRNANGELGNGNRELQRAPVQFQLPGALTAVDVAAYYEDGTNTEDAVFVLASDGNVYGAGSNYYGVLGYGGGVETQSTPVQFQLPGGVSSNCNAIPTETKHARTRQ